MKAHVKYVIVADIRPVYGTGFSKLASDRATLKIFNYKPMGDALRLIPWIETFIILKNFDAEKDIPQIIEDSGRGPFSKLKIERL